MSSHNLDTLRSKSNVVRPPPSGSILQKQSSFTRPQHQSNSDLAIPLHTHNTSLKTIPVGEHKPTSTGASDDASHAASSRNENSLSDAKHKRTDVMKSKSSDSASVALLSGPGRPFNAPGRTPTDATRQSTPINGTQSISSRRAQSSSTPPSKPREFEPLAVKTTQDVSSSDTNNNGSMVPTPKSSLPPPAHALMSHVAAKVADFEKSAALSKHIEDSHVQIPRATSTAPCKAANPSTVHASASTAAKMAPVTPRLCNTSPTNKQPTSDRAAGIVTNTTSTTNTTPTSSSTTPSYLSNAEKNEKSKTVSSHAAITDASPASKAEPTSANNNKHKPNTKYANVTPPMVASVTSTNPTEVMSKSDKGSIRSNASSAVKTGLAVPMTIVPTASLQPTTGSFFGMQPSMQRGSMYGMQPAMGSMYGMQPAMGSIYGMQPPMQRGSMYGMQPAMGSMYGMQPPMQRGSMYGMQPAMGSMYGMQPPMQRGSMYGMQPAMGSMYGMQPPMQRGSMYGMQPAMGSMYGMRPQMGSLHGASVYGMLGSMHGGFGSEGVQPLHKQFSTDDMYSTVSKAVPGNMPADPSNQCVSGMFRLASDLDKHGVHMDELFDDVESLSSKQMLRRSGKRGGHNLYTEGLHSVPLDVESTITPEEPAYNSNQHNVADGKVTIAEDVKLVKNSAPRLPVAQSATSMDEKNYTLRKDRPHAHVPCNYNVHTLCVVDDNGPMNVQAEEPYNVLINRDKEKDTFELDEVIKRERSSTEIKSVLLSELRGNWLNGHNSSLLVMTGADKSSEGIAMARRFIARSVARAVEESGATSGFDVTINAVSLRGSDMCCDLLDSSKSYQKTNLGSSPVYGPCLLGIKSKTVKTVEACIDVFDRAMHDAKIGQEIVAIFLLLKRYKISATEKEVRLSSLFVSLFGDNIHSVTDLRSKSNSSPHRLFRYCLGGASVTVSALCVSSTDTNATKALSELKDLRQIKNSPPRSGNIKRFIDYTENEIARQWQKIERVSYQDKAARESQIKRMEEMVEDAKKLYNDYTLPVSMGYQFH